jgi:hypothetical protein
MAVRTAKAKSMVYVGEGIFVGNKHAAQQSFEMLSNHNIRLIVSVAGGSRQRADIAHLTIGVSDKNDESLLPFFAPAIRTIRLSQQGGLSQHQLQETQDEIRRLKHHCRRGAQTKHQLDVYTRPKVPLSNVLIHCMGGFSRSPTMVAALLISMGMSTEESLACLLKANPKSNPKPIFIQDLQAWEAMLETSILDGVDQDASLEIVQVSSTGTNSC